MTDTWKGVITRRASQDGEQQSVYEVGIHDYTTQDQYFRIGELRVDNKIYENLPALGKTAVDLVTIDDILDITTFETPTEI